MGSQKGGSLVLSGESLRLRRAAEISPALCCMCTWLFLFYATGVRVVAGPLWCLCTVCLGRLVLCQEDSLLCLALAFSALCALRAQLFCLFHIIFADILNIALRHKYSLDAALDINSPTNVSNAFYVYLLHIAVPGRQTENSEIREYKDDCCNNEE